MGLVKKEQTLNEFIQGLAKEGVKIVLRQNSRGNIYGLTYIDLKNKCVFNGSDLGKEFSAKGIIEQLLPEQKYEEVNKLSQMQTIIKQANENSNHSHKQAIKQSHEHKQKQELLNVLDLLLKAEQNVNFMPYELLKKKRKKKTRRLNW